MKNETSSEPTRQPSIDPRVANRCKNYALTKLAELHHEEYIELVNFYRERSGLPLFNKHHQLYRPYIYKVKDIPQ